VRYITFTCDNGHTYHYTERWLLGYAQEHRPRDDEVTYTFQCPVCDVPVRRKVYGGTPLFESAAWLKGKL